MEHTTTAVTVQVISKQSQVSPSHPDDVHFKVQYKEGYKGPKFMTEGNVTVVNKDLAAEFEKSGRGFICDAEGNKVEEKNAEDVTAENDGNVQQPTDYTKLLKEDLVKLVTEREIEFDKTAKKDDLVKLLQDDDAAKQ